MVRLPDGLRRPFVMWSDPVTKQVCREVLEGTSYPIVPIKFQVNMILDIGANVGSASVYFRSYYPKAFINAYEPYPASFDLLVKNTAGLDIECHNKAVTDQKGRTALYAGHIGPAGFNVCHPDQQECITIDTVSAKDLVRQLEPDILKVDTEGSEWDIFEGAGEELLARISVIYVEYHSDHHRRKIDEKLPRHLLHFASVKNTKYGELCYVRKELVKG